MHLIIWLHIFLSNHNNFQTSIWCLDRILTDSTTLGQSEAGSNSNRGALHTTQILGTGASLPDVRFRTPLFLSLTSLQLVWSAYSKLYPQGIQKYYVHIWTTIETKFLNKYHLPGLCNGLLSRQVNLHKWVQVSGCSIHTALCHM